MIAGVIDMKFQEQDIRRGFFQGWYLKHQGEEGSLAVIPAVHKDRNGQCTASIQVITPEMAKTVFYPGQSFQNWRDGFQVRVGESWFSSEGIHLDVRDRDFTVQGDVQYGMMTPLPRDIMGPFQKIPGLQCRHGVLSMGHQLQGGLWLNGRRMDFKGGTGYIEMDQGRSFPRRYLWTQCSWDERQKVSLMLAIAHIPLPLGGFTGCICSLLHAGTFYRLATYQGVKIERWSGQGAVVRQGNRKLAVELLRDRPQTLSAPQGGSMSRVVDESLCALVRYRFWKGEQLVFDHTDSRASFEYANWTAGEKHRILGPS